MTKRQELVEYISNLTPEQVATVLNNLDRIKKEVGCNE